MEIHIKVSGILMIVLALIHIGFPAYFRWKQEFAAVSLINRQMMYVHTFFLALIVLLMGLGALFWPGLFLNKDTGPVAAGGYAFFWGLRLIFQFAVYSPLLWRGKLMETTIHVVFSAIWAYFTVVYSLLAAAL